MAGINLYPTLTDKKSINVQFSTSGIIVPIVGSRGEDAGNGAFESSIRHGFGVQKVSKILPTYVQIPHVFPNVPYNSDIELVRNSDMAVLASFTLPIAWYTTQEFLEYLLANGIVNDDTTELISIDPITKKFVFTPDQSYTLSMPQFLFEMIGYKEIASFSNTVTDFMWSWVPNEESSDTVNVPNFAGVKFVHVLMGKIGAFNLLSNHGDENGHWPNFASVNMSNTPYGGTATWRATTLHVDDIDFRTDINVSDIECRVVDENFKQLYIPTNHNVHLIMKCFHEDETR